MTWNSWYTWSIATVLMLLYVSAGSVASQTDVISVRLEPGYSTQLHVFRLAEDVLRMQLKFKVGDKPRPELGSYATREDWRKTGLLKLVNPGSAVRIAASMPDAAPVTYEAMPNSVVYPPSSAVRDLTSGISIAPGVWQWPPARNELVLHRGVNVVNIEVVVAERPLEGEDVELWVMPALGFKIGMPNVAWLWFSYLWPFLVIVQASWAFAIARQRHQSGV
jgi:hypothetical protein